MAGSKPSSLSAGYARARAGDFLEDLVERHDKEAPPLKVHKTDYFQTVSDAIVSEKVMPPVLEKSPLAILSLPTDTLGGCSLTPLGAMMAFEDVCTHALDNAIVKVPMRPAPGKLINNEYDKAAEVLRHFWSCFVPSPPRTPKVRAKAKKLAEFLERYLENTFLVS